jgi:hypothetical protein
MSTKFDQILAAGDAYTAAVVEVVVDDVIDKVRDWCDDPRLLNMVPDLVARLEQYKAAANRRVK